MTFNEDSTSYGLLGGWKTLPLIRKNPIVTINTDALSYGWGASFEGNNTEGQLTLEKCELHINVLALKDALFGLQVLCSHTQKIHIDKN